MKTQILKHTLAQYGVEIQHYFDRVHYYLDSATSESDLEPLIHSKATRADLEKQNKFGWHVLSTHVHFDRKLELFQLNKNDLANILKIEGDYRINYVEISIDFLCPNKKIFNELTKFFHQHLVSVNQNTKKKPYFHLYGKKDEDKCNSVYFNHKGDKGRLVYYGDHKMGRMSSKKTLCLHIEYRVKGISALEKLGIFTSQDLVNFQHENLWDELLDFRVCNNTKLGKFFYNDKQPTRKTLGQKGKAEAQTICYLQKYISENPDHISAFPKITTDKKLQNLLDNLNLPKVQNALD